MVATGTVARGAAALGAALGFAVAPPGVALAVGGGKSFVLQPALSQVPLGEDIGVEDAFGADDGLAREVAGDLIVPVRHVDRPQATPAELVADLTHLRPLDPAGTAPCLLACSIASV